MRNIREEFEYIVENEGENIKRKIALTLETKWQACGKNVVDEEKQQMITSAIQMSVNEMSIATVLNNVVDWINAWEKRFGKREEWEI
jgi:hypothetical protein